MQVKVARLLIRLSPALLTNWRQRKTLIVANIPERHHEYIVKVVTTLAGLVKADVKITDIETDFRLKNDRCD